MTLDHCLKGMLHQCPYHAIFMLFCQLVV